MKSFLLLVILLAVGVTVLAGDPDVDFAAILIEEFGYADLAIAVLQEAANDAEKSDKARASAHLELADLYMQIAENEKDTSKKKDYSGKAEKHLKDFERLGGAESSPDIFLKVAGIQRQNAVALNREAEKEGLTKEKKQEALKKAVESFEIAISKYEKIQKQLKEKYDEIKDNKKVRKRERDETQGIYGTAWFQALWTKQMKAEIMPKGKDKTKLLNDLIEEIEDDFVPDFMGWGLEYYGRWLKGVCHWNSGQRKEAIGCLDEVLEDLKTNKLLRDLEDVTRKVYLLKSDVYTDWAKADKKNASSHYVNEIKAIDDLFKQFPDIRRSKNDQELGFYCNCLLKQAKAYAGLDKYGKALKKAAWIFENGTAGWKNLVSKLVEEWLAKAETATAFFMTARQHMIDQTFDKALLSYRKGLAKATPDEKARYGETAWNHMGICYYNLNQLYEAGMAFGKFATLGDELAQKGLFLRARSFGRRFYASNENAAKAPKEKREEARAVVAFDSKLWLQAMLDFMEKFPDKEPDMNYLIAERYRVHGDFDNAQKWYDKTREKSQYYDKSRFRQPMVLWTRYEELKKENAEADKIKLALLNVVRKFRDYVRWNEETRAKKDDPKLKTDLLRKASTAEELTAHAFLELTNMAAKAGQSEEMNRNAKTVIDTLNGFEKKYSYKKSFAKIQLVRIRAYAKLLDVEKIEEELERLIKEEKKREKKGKKSKAVRDGLAIAANAFLGAAEKEQDPEKKSLYNNKAAELFEGLLNYDPAQKGDMFFWVGDQLYKMGRFKRAAGMYESFLVKFGAAPETKKEDLLHAYFRLSECYLKLNEHDKAIGYLTKLLVEPDWVWDARRMLIDAHHGKGLILENEAKKESIGKALEILNKEIVPKVKPQSPEWYEFKRKMIEIYLDMGEYLGALVRAEMIDKDYMWGNQKRREELADLLEKYSDMVDDEEIMLRWNAALERLRKPVEIPAAPREPEKILEEPTNVTE